MSQRQALSLKTLGSALLVPPASGGSWHSLARGSITLTSVSLSSHVLPHLVPPATSTTVSHKDTLSHHGVISPGEPHCHASTVAPCWRLERGCSAPGIFDKASSLCRLGTEKPEAASGGCGSFVRDLKRDPREDRQQEAWEEECEW